MYFLEFHLECTVSKMNLHSRVLLPFKIIVPQLLINKFLLNFRFCL